MDLKMDEMYLSWLYSLVERVDDPPFYNLMRQMFRTKFDWFVPNDDNRATDGMALRNRFMFERDIKDPDTEWLSLDCSFLEMLIALSERLAFNMNVSVPNAFWHMMHNLGFDELYSDDNFFEPDDVEDVLGRVVWRNYSEDGSGGIFPLNNPDHDQREIELIYQMYSYALEQGF